MRQREGGVEWGSENDGFRLVRRRRHRSGSSSTQPLCLRVRGGFERLRLVRKPFRASPKSTRNDKFFVTTSDV